MRRWQWLILIAAIIVGRGCTCGQMLTGAEDMGDGGSGGLTIGPAGPVTLNVTAGQPPPTQAFTATDANGMDVTSQASFMISDPTLGSFNGNVFTPSGTHGGTATITVSDNGLTGTATITVVLHASITNTTCPGCPAFPPSSTPACTSMIRNPTVLYPPNNTLVPPNMNVIATQFDQGTGNTLFEIDFENAVTDVRVETQCTAITDTKGLATNGCIYDLDQTVWNYVAQTNAGGDPVTISVKATDASQSCVATSSSTNILFAEQPLQGGIYYWQSVVIGGVQGASGGIFTYDFGNRNLTPNPYLTPSGTTNKCVGCHFLSRDGLKMTYGSDDADADDEYGDLHPQLLDVMTKSIGNTTMLPPGFQTFSPDHSLFLASDGKAANNPPAFYLFNSSNGSAATPATVPSGGLRGTQPDWSPDGKTIVFVQVPSGDFFTNTGGTGTNGDDEHFYSGSLFTMSYNAASKTFGSPTALLTSAGENNYYPAFSPDNKFVIFNRAPMTSPALSNDAFSNINAQVMLMPATAGATPMALTALNNGNNSMLTNSWPRFAPTVQTYKGHQLAWVTFSSTRDYGDKVRNSVMVPNGMGMNVAQVNCYPSESPENPNGSKTQPLAPNCHQPQIWMAAIDLTAAASGSGDPSSPAFWLPFQDVTAHNHIAQWVITIVNNPAGGADGGTGGSCIPLSSACTAGANCCGSVCSNGTCTIP